MPFGGTAHSRLKFGPTRRSALQFLFAGIRVIRGQNFCHPVSNFRFVLHSRASVFHGRDDHAPFSFSQRLGGSAGGFAEEERRFAPEAWVGNGGQPYLGFSIRGLLPFVALRLRVRLLFGGTALRA